MKTPYRTAPTPYTEIPKDIPFIIVNELAERFCYYGMRAILVVFMTQYLMDSSGNFALGNLFTSAVNFSLKIPMVPAVLPEHIISGFLPD